MGFAGPAVKRRLSPLLDGILQGSEVQPTNTSVPITFREIPEVHDYLVFVQAHR